MLDKNGKKLTGAQVLERYILTFSGLLKVNVNKTVERDLIFFEASNGAASGGARDYLIDYSFLQLSNSKDDGNKQ